jgi:hypothetical protein
MLRARLLAVAADIHRGHGLADGRSFKLYDALSVRSADYQPGYTVTDIGEAGEPAIHFTTRSANDHVAVPRF